VRTVFLGNDARSVPSLLALAGSGHRPALVVTRAPRPAGRGGKPRPTAVAGAARERGLPLAEFETVKRGPGLEALSEARPDALVVVAYGEILPAEILALPSIAPVNLHLSLLPALLEGHPVTGVTTIRMDEGMDTGPVLLQVEEAIDDAEDAGSLGDRLAVRGGELLVATLDALKRGDLEERAQDESLATYAPRFTPEEEWIDWSEDPEKVRRRVRALAPNPGARTSYRDRTLKVIRARHAEGTGEPGAILDVSREGPVVAASSGALLLEAVVPEGRRRMPGADWARGARPEAGERLGGREG
jgi:methionyl-tRNA formyltransferase